MDSAALIVALVVTLACGAAGSVIMASKGRDRVAGFALGFFLGLIGLVICACMSKTTEKRVEEQMDFDDTMRRIHGLPGPNESVEVPRTPAHRMGGDRSGE